MNKKGFLDEVRQIATIANAWMASFHLTTVKTWRVRFLSRLSRTCRHHLFWFSGHPVCHGKSCRVIDALWEYIGLDTHHLLCPLPVRILKFNSNFLPGLLQIRLLSRKSTATKNQWMNLKCNRTGGDQCKLRIYQMFSISDWWPKKRGLRVVYALL
jgi:hypothetical protein